MTLGGYSKNGEKFYDANRYSFTSHRIEGSFHWEFKINKLIVGDQYSIPTQRWLHTDLGTSATFLPK
jgi:hypothetical protein